MSTELFGTNSLDRSVSIVLSYILVLAISTVLIAGLLVAGTSFVEDNRERVIESELTVIGNHIAGNMEQVDRMVGATNANFDDPDEDPSEAYINQSFQRLVTGSSYDVSVVDNGGTPQVVLSAADPQVTVHVNATLQNADVRETTVNGGSISVYYDGDRLVVDDA